MKRYDKIISEFARMTYTMDDLDRISYSTNLELLIKEVNEIGYLDLDYVERLENYSIYFIEYLMKYKSISEREAIALINYCYISFDIMLDILEHHVEDRTGDSEQR